MVDYHNLLFLYLYKDNAEKIPILREEPTKSIIEFYTNLYGHKSPMNFDKGIDFLEMIQERLKKEIKKIVSSKGIYYWFHLYRRIAPEKSFDEGETTLYLYRNMAECSFLKYGKMNTEEELVFGYENNKISDEEIANGLYKEACEYYLEDEYEPSDNIGIYLGDFDFDDLVEIYSLERLMYEYWHTTMCIRRLYKGGKLYIKNNNYYVENDIETEELMNIYDYRAKKAILSTSSGVIISKEDMNKKGVGLLAQYNIKQISLRKYPYHYIFRVPKSYNSLDEDDTPNFLWFPFDFDYYYQVNSHIKEEFKEKYGYSFESFVYVLFLMTMHPIEMSLNSNKVGIGLVKRGYKHFTSKHEYINKLLDLSNNFKIPSLKDYDLSFLEVQLCLKDLTFGYNDKDNICLTTLGPRKLIIPSANNSFFVDYAAIIFILRTKTHFLDYDGNIKGHLFEDAVIEILEKNKVKMWECQKELKHKDGSSKEIDISMIYENILFIGELKSNEMSFAFTIGTRDALNFRKDKINKALGQVDDKALWLSTHQKGTNYNIPKYIDIIVPLCVSPFAEYIWTKSEEYWITDELPRICTPRELPHLLSEDIISNIGNKPYVINLT